MAKLRNIDKLQVDGMHGGLMRKFLRPSPKVAATIRSANHAVAKRRKYTRLAGRDKRGDHAREPIHVIGMQVIIILFVVRPVFHWVHRKEPWAIEVLGCVE